MNARAAAAPAQEDFTGWTPEGLGSAIRMTAGELTAPTTRVKRRIVTATLALALALAAAAAIGAIQIFGGRGKARRFRER